MRIYYIKVHTVYYETRDLLSGTKLRIYDKDEHKKVKVSISYKYAMDLNTFLFDPTRLKIGHS